MPHVQKRDKPEIDAGKGECYRCPVTGACLRSQFHTASVEFLMRYFSLLPLRYLQHYKFAMWLSVWLWMTPWGAVLAHPAWGIVVDAKGSVYFADSERARIWKFTWRGALVQLVNGKQSHELFLDTNANLYGEHIVRDATTGQWKVTHWQFNPEDKLIDLGEPPDNVRLARDAVGNQFGVARDAQTVRLFRRTPNGQISLLAGGLRGHADGPGAQARFMGIEALIVGTDGALYVRDDDCIRRVSLAGEVRTVGGKPLAGLARANELSSGGLAADKRGNVFVADTAHGVVRKLSLDNHVETVLQTGWFWTPTGVAVANDELYVLEALPDYPLRLLAVSGIGPYLRVQKLAADGRVQTLATVWGTTTRLLLGVMILLGALFALWRLRQREFQRGLAT
jgi:hypothetical protein